MLTKTVARPVPETVLMLHVEAWTRHGQAPPSPAVLRVIWCRPLPTRGHQWCLVKMCFVQMCPAAFWSGEKHLCISTHLPLHSTVQRTVSWEARRLRPGGPADVSAQPDGGRTHPYMCPQVTWGSNLSITRLQMPRVCLLYSVPSPGPCPGGWSH